MMRTIRAAVVIVAVLALSLAAGCGTTKPSSPPDDAKATTTTTAPSADKKGHLTLGPLKMYADDRLILEINAEGDISADILGNQDKATGKITTEGVLTTSTEPGRSVQLLPDGTLKAMSSSSETPKVLPVTVSDDGTIKSADATLTFASDGTLQGMPAAAGKVRIEGIDDKTRRLAAFLVAALFVGIDASSEVVETPTPEPSN